MNKFQKDSTPLTRHPTDYSGNFQRLEVMPFSPDIHDGPGVYLQSVEGCGYLVYELTPDEARKLAKSLIESADWTDNQKWEPPVVSR